MKKTDNKKNKSYKEKKIEEKNKLKKEKKEIKDYTKLKRIAKVVMIICAVIIVFEVIAMLLMNTKKENEITYIDTLNSIENVNNEYYLGAGSSNFKHSNYNTPFTYEYEDGIQKGKINKVYAEQAKLVKYDNEMNIVFEKTFKTDYDSVYYDAKANKDFIVAVGSYVYDKSQLSINTRDGLIVKYDLDGNMIWSNNYQVLGDTEFKSVIIVEDGIIAVGQSIYENMQIGNHPTGGGIIVKYDFDGNEVWHNNFGGNKSGIFEEIVPVDDGYIVCGKDALNYGLLIKYKLNGDLEWKNNYEFTDTYGMYDLEVKDDKIYIASGVNTSNEKNEDGDLIYQYDAGIIVFDMNGDLVDTYSIGGSGDDRFNSLMLLDDKIIAVGYTNSKDIKIKDLDYKEDMSEGIIVTFDYDGKVLDTKAYSGDKNDLLTDIDFAIPGTADEINGTKPYVISGYSNSKHGLFKGNNKDYYGKLLKYNEKLELVNEK